MNGPFDNDNNQFVISYELLCLFQWLFEHEQETLKKLMEKALNNGLHERLYQRNTILQQSPQEDLQQSIIDFFSLLEILLYELLNEKQVKKVIEQNLMPAIKNIDSAAYDNATLALSIAKATAFYESNPEQNPKDILCKEILKRWKPSKKIALN